MSEKTYCVTVFGKAGCDKCKVLQKRLDDILAKPEWHDFEKAYADVETEDGLVAFCRAECVNPARVPGLVVSRRDPVSGHYHLVVNPEPGKAAPLLKKAGLYTYIGLQTDYTDDGQGVITPRMITTTLEAARKASAA